MHSGYNWRCREEGDLAAVSFQSCEGEQGFRGFGVYDVTNPAQPEKLALVATNKAANGSHEIWLDTRGGHADVYTAIILSELTTSPDFDPETFDATIPWEPDFQIWTCPGRAAPPRSASGAPGRSSASSRSSRTRTAPSGSTSPTRSSPPAGTPTCPTGTWAPSSSTCATLPGRASSAAPPSGPTRSNAHSSWLADGGRVLIQNDEDFDPSPDPNGVVETSWGYARYVDISDPAHPGRLTRFELPSTSSLGIPTRMTRSPLMVHLRPDCTGASASVALL